MLPSLYPKPQSEINDYKLPDQQLRKTGYIYSIYRFIISIFLFLSSYAVVFQDDRVFVTLPSFLYQTILLFYSLFSFLLLALFYVIPRFMRRQLGIGLVFDILVISTLLYLTGSADIQLIMLYVVVVAASFMMLAPYQALIITLLAIIFVIYHQFFLVITNSRSIAELGDAVLLSLSFLGVGFLSWFVSQRLAMVEKLATERANEVAKLNIINQQVISTISHGVMVLSKDLELKLTNLATIDLLDLKLPLLTLANIHQDNIATKDFINQLTQQHPYLYTLIKRASHYISSSFVYDVSHTDSLVNKLRINITPLEDGSLLLVIEDIRREQSNAQQLKLAALGQLTASIAHEIRNPLAAISQASQLLIEDVQLSSTTTPQSDSIQSNSNEHSNTSQAVNTALEQPQEQSVNSSANFELYEMIYNQTKRVNRIIEDVLKLSRQDTADSTIFSLVKWLKQFINEHYGSHDVFLRDNCNPKIKFDTHQLEQILVNLVNNGLRYSSKSHPHAFVEIEVDCRKNDVIIDILDTGTGVQDKDINSLFNPFFTTNSDGTGLGLYLSQAFAEANNARLVYVPEHKKTCFRLLIPKV